MDLTWIMQSVIMLGIGALGFFIKDLKRSIAEDITENKQEIRVVKNDLNDFKETVALRYVQKDEFVAAISNMDKKLDKIYDKVIERGEK